MFSSRITAVLTDTLPALLLFTAIGVHAQAPPASAAQPLPAPVQTSAAKELTLNPALPTVFIVGDSTARNQANLGWGDHLARYFDTSRINVANRAIAGRSTRTFTHIGRDEKIGGSNTSAGDIETRKFKDLYKPSTDASGKEIISEETIGGKIPVYRIEVVAKVNDVKFPKLVMWVTRDKFLELKRESYGLSGTLMETDLYTNYKNVDGRFVPLLQKFVDEVEKGKVSVLEISAISFNKVDDYKFDKSYLESLSK